MRIPTLAAAVATIVLYSSLVSAADIDCPQGQYGRQRLDGSGNAVLDSQGNPQYLCSSCPHGYTSPRGSINIESCAYKICLDGQTGSFNPSTGIFDGDCVDCPDFGYSVVGEPRCSSCAPGTTLNPHRNGCVPCSPGSYSEQGGSECTLCPNNAPSPQGAFSVLQCQAACPPGEALNDREQCTQCPAGSFTLGYYTPCESCPAGTISSR